METLEHINYKKFGRIIFRRNYFERIFYDLGIKNLGRLEIWAQTFCFIFYQKFDN